MMRDSDAQAVFMLLGWVSTWTFLPAWLQIPLTTLVVVSFIEMWLSKRREEAIQAAILHFLSNGQEREFGEVYSHCVQELPHNPSWLECLFALDHLCKAGMLIYRITDKYLVYYRRTGKRKLKQDAQEKLKLDWGNWGTPLEPARQLLVVLFDRGHRNFEPLYLDSRPAMRKFGMHLSRAGKDRR